MPADETPGRDPEIRVVDRRWWARGDRPDPVEPDRIRKPSVVEDLERRLADLTSQLGEQLAERRRASEEFDQIRARMKREAEREVERGRRTLLLEMLDVLDNLDRALQARPPAAGATEGVLTDQIDRLIQGVQLVRDQFLAKLETLGVVRVEASGAPFDASRHEAVSIEPVDDEARHGTVVAVIKEGYMIGETLLRPATVVVGRKE